jgi:apolipoprotein N-acyltransferase
MLVKSRDPTKFVLNWLAIVAIICWVLIPIRVYILHANDWLVGLLSILGLVFIGAYFILNWQWKPKIPSPKDK